MQQRLNSFFLNLFILFYLFLAVLGLCCCEWVFSSCGEQGLLLVVVHRLLIVVASRCGARALGMRAQQLWLPSSRAQALQLWRMGLVALRHVGSSGTRARTRVPCIGRRILNHCTTREAHKGLILSYTTSQGRLDIFSLCLSSHSDSGITAASNLQHHISEFSHMAGRKRWRRCTESYLP